MIKPTSTRILVERIEKQNKTKSGLLLGPGREFEDFSTVRGIGPSVKEVSIGDKVLLKEYLTTRVVYDGTEYGIVDESDVIGIVKG